MEWVGDTIEVQPKKKKETGAMTCGGSERGLERRW